MWNLALEEVVLIQEEDLREASLMRENESFIPVAVIAYYRCLLEPLRVAYRVPDGHSVLHLILEPWRAMTSVEFDARRS